MLRYRVDYAGVAILSRKWGGLLGDALWNNVFLSAICNMKTRLDNANNNNRYVYLSGTCVSIRSKSNKL